MPQRNVGSWNTMIAGYAQYEFVAIARELFDRMPQKRCSLKEFLKAYGNSVKKAANQLRACLTWRDNIPIEHLIADEFSAELAEGIAFVAGRDEEARPVIIFFDDSTRNIVVSKAAGLHTVLVGSSVRTEGADFALRSIHNIKEALPEIWEDGEKFEVQSPSIAIETMVVA
ncbi:hypothetical protein KI387_023312 [Taxus chinensis]|uniref:Uncharacterized protein n=1 Tax=Taxus chinensis TaxID=29808 RepID=A0AA38G3L7_TAXCH|nr:hypothetical protein KI387_023312 [Taxus chinensis]